MIIRYVRRYKRTTTRYMELSIQPANHRQLRSRTKSNTVTRKLLPTGVQENDYKQPEDTMQSRKELANTGSNSTSARGCNKPPENETEYKQANQTPPQTIEETGPPGKCLA